MTQDWQPIKTAPKDGTVFLGYAIRESYPSVARWHRGAFRTVIEEIALLEHGRWRGWPLTHWMPLPDPPVSASPEEP